MDNNRKFGKRIVVATPVGTLPMGGTNAISPVYALESTPSILKFNNNMHNQTKTDINVEEMLAFTVDNVLTNAEADTLISLTEELGYRSDAPGISTPPGMRQNKTVHWVSDPHLLNIIHSRIIKFLPKEIEGKKISPTLSHRLNFYRYDDGDVFNKHFDGGWPGYGLDGAGTSMIEWSGMHSQLTMLLYLNGKKDGVEGGKTVLYGKDNTSIEVTPEKGKALFFRHGQSSQSVLHVGAQVHGDTPKYVARINILYDN